jgi:hypothetical protein
VGICTGLGWLRIEAGGRQLSVAYPEIFFGGISTNSVNRGQREQGSGGGSPLVRGSAQFAIG